MKDKTTLEISEELRQYIEALVEKVVLEGMSFEDYKKWLQRYSINEYIEYQDLERNLIKLFTTAEDIKNHESELNPAVNSEICGWTKDFLHQFRLAYCQKDITYLEKVFSSNSQIITGAYVNDKNVRYRAQRKKQYMANLRYIFAKNKNIDVAFDMDEMTGVLYESADGRFQIVRLLQLWCSDNYSDRGYLSLLIVSDQDTPKVLLRTWQPIIN